MGRVWAARAAVAGLVLAALVPLPVLPPHASASAVLGAAVAVVTPESPVLEPAPVQPVQVVNPEQVYSYAQVTADLQALAAAYPGLVTVRTIGQSEYGRQLWAARLGTGPAAALIHATHHACEWLTTNLVMTMLDRYAAAWVTGDFEGEPVPAEASIWFVPMVNPDGATLQQQGLSAFPPEAHEALLAMNGGSTDFSRWKANAKGVDLNRQYPADWEHIVANPPGPTAANYKGEAPLTAPEAQALAAFTYEIDPEITLAYHSTGQIIFWHFHNRPEHLERDRRLAEEFAALTGYWLVPPAPNPSGGGYKDWFIQTFGRPGFTPEIAPYVDGGPPPLSAFAGEWERNKRAGLWAATKAVQLREARTGTAGGIGKKPGE